MAKVLFVDDQANILKALYRTVEDEDFEIFTAESGDEGLKLVKEHDFDIIFSDIRMPEMDGIEFLSKSREISPNSVRIVLSAFADREQVLDAVNKSFIWSYQVKPWDDDALILTLRNAKSFFDQQLENSRLSEELQKSYEQLSAYNDELEIRVWERTKELTMREKTLRLLLEKKDLNIVKKAVEKDIITLTKAEDALISHEVIKEEGFKSIQMWRQNQCQGYIGLKGAKEDAMDRIEGYMPIVEIFISMWKVMQKKDSILGSIDDLLESLED